MLHYETTRVFVLVAILSIILWCTVQYVEAGDNEQTASTSGIKNPGGSFDGAEYHNASSHLPPTEDTSETEELAKVDPSFLENFMKKYKSLHVDKKLKWDVLYLKLRRTSIYDDSYQQITDAKADEWPTKHIEVRYEGEKTKYSQGLLREWFYLLSKEIFNPSRGLFEYVDSGRNSYLQIDPKSGEKNPDHLQHFEFVGKFLGLAISRGRRIRVKLIRSFFTRILNQRISIEDTNDIITVDSRFETFATRIRSDSNALEAKLRSLEVDRIGPITNDDAEEYLRLAADWKYVAKVEKQISALIQGLEQVIPLNSIRANLNAKELEFLINDKYELDLGEWRKYAKYREYKSKDSIIIWFWDIIKEYDESGRRKILQFATGSDAVSLQANFKQMSPSFTIAKPRKNQGTIESKIKDREIRIPPHYTTKAELKIELDKIIQQ